MTSPWKHKLFTDGDRFLTREHDGTTSLRDSATGEVVVALRGCSEQPAYALSPDRRWLAAGYDPVQLWDLGKAVIVRTFASDLTARLQFTPDGSGLVVITTMTPQSGMEDEVTYKTYDVRTGALVDEKSCWERQG